MTTPIRTTRPKDHAELQAALLILGLAACAWEPMVFVPIGLFWVLPVIVAIGLGHSRGRNGWVWGFLLGWLGVLILAIMRPRSAVDELAELEAERKLRQLEQQELLARIDRYPKR